MASIREAMKVLGVEPMGGAGVIVEGGRNFHRSRVEGYTPKARGGNADKNAVLTLVERGGSARSFHLDSMKMEQIAPLVLQNVLREKPSYDGRSQPALRCNWPGVRRA